MSEALKNSRVPKRGDFFRHGYLKDKVGGYLCCKYQWPWSAFEMFQKELMLMYEMEMGSINSGYKTIQEPPVRENALVHNFVNFRAELNGHQLRELAKEVFEELMMIGVKK